MAIQFIDLCSGIGGFHSGLMATGHYECVGHAEIDPNAAKAYKAIYGEEGGLNYGDLREIDPKQLPDFELLCAGFPCQSFSVAGRRLGFQDTRGTVFFEIARIIAEKRPPFLLLENVPGLLSHDSGRTLTTIFSSLVEMGYHLEWMVLNSKYFGVPQQRRRLYIVGYLDARCAGKVFPLGSSYAKNLKQLIPGAQGQRVYETDGVACTQCASAGGWGGKTGLYFIDMNVNPKITEVARMKCRGAQIRTTIGGIFTHQLVCGIKQVLRQIRCAERCAITTGIYSIQRSRIQNLFSPVKMCGICPPHKSL